MSYLEYLKDADLGVQWLHGWTVLLVPIVLMFTSAISCYSTQEDAYAVQLTNDGHSAAEVRCIIERSDRACERIK